jgi:drug/metabolite transporter (DMT)-like permease
MKALSPSIQGIVAVVLSQLAFVLNDTFVKLAGAALPMGEIMFLRGIVATVLIGGLVAALRLHRELPLLLDPLVVLRTMGELGGTFFYLLALFNMPFANVIIVFQAVPLSAAAGAALFLGEAVGWRRWMAILVGFAGVLIVVRPGMTGFDVYGLLVLVSVLFVSVRDLATRAMPVRVPTVLVSFVTAIAVTTMGALMGLTEDWVRPSGTHLMQLSSAAILLSVGYFTVIAGMRIGDISVTAPFRYVAVVFAVTAGFFVWGDIPDAMMLVGSALIIGAGVYTFTRERRPNGAVADERASAAAAPPPI